MGWGWYPRLVLGLGLVGLGLATPVLFFVPSPGAIAAPLQGIQSQGNQIRLNGRTIRGTWATWQENGETRLGIESMTLEQSLGMTLLNNSSLEMQEVNALGQTVSLPIRVGNPYRYLDVTAWAKTAQWQWRSPGNTLELQTPATKILGIRTGTQTWGQRVVIDLDRPVLWRRVSPTRIALQANLATATNAQSTSSTSTTPFTVASQGQETTLTFGANTANQLQVTTLANPPRLMIDLRQGTPTTTKRTIQWLAGVTWRQEQWGRGLRVTWLEIDPTQPGLKLRPITPARDTVVGVASILTQAETNRAIAAINAGFFNRNNQYPLGAIRADGVWRSSPILNRGVVAWDNQGNWLFDRLSLQESFTGSNGSIVTADLVNSGYVKAGAALYTPAWGSSYTPLADNEVILTVDNHRVVRADTAQKAGGDRYAMPSTGYLLVFRSFRSGAERFPVGTTLQQTTTITPPEFATFPHIMGAGPLLVKDSQVVLNGQAEQFSAAFNIQSASRSAIARTRDNKIILATLHGAAEETAGVTLRQWADILVQLGATDALNLDGGGSTSLAIGGNLGDRHPATAGRVHNGIGLFLE